jgi:hypothetical protein
MKGIGTKKVGNFNEIYLQNVVGQKTCKLNIRPLKHKSKIKETNQSRQNRAEKVYFAKQRS